MDYRAIMRSQTEIGTAAARNAANRAPRRASAPAAARLERSTIHPTE